MRARRRDAVSGVLPDRLQHAPDGVGVDLIDRRVPDRRGVGGQRRRPLSCVLGVAPSGLVRPDIGVGALAEGGRASLRRDGGFGGPPVADRVDLLGHVGDQPFVLGAGVGERHCRVGTIGRIAIAMSSNSVILSSRSARRPTMKATRCGAASVRYGWNARRERAPTAKRSCIIAATATHTSFAG